MISESFKKRFFNLSLHRTGTQSTHALFLSSGIKSVHWPSQVGGIDYETQIRGAETDLEFVTHKLRPVFRKYSEISDVPIPALYKQLAQQFPRARFYMMVRSPSSWIASVRRHIGLRDFDPFEKVLYWRFFETLPTSMAEITDIELARFHDWHHQTIFDFFNLTPARAPLVMQLGEASNGDKLCEFCGLVSSQLQFVDYAMTGSHPAALA